MEGKDTSGLPRVGKMSGEKHNFLQVREKSENFEKMSENFGHLTHVREFCGIMSRNCLGILSLHYF